MRIITSLNFSFLAIASCLAGCTITREVVTSEHHEKVTVLHHKRRVAGGSVDRIEAIDTKGIVTQAEVKVYDVGRLPTGNGGMSEAHRYYQVVQDAHFSLSLPKKVSTGHRSVYTPPNYVPPPEDQRINDAVADVDKVKKKLTDQIAQDNAMKGELQTQIDKNQALTDQLNMAMSTQKKPDEKTPAGDAAESELRAWRPGQ